MNHASCNMRCVWKINRRRYNYKHNSRDKPGDHHFVGLHEGRYIDPKSPATSPLDEIAGWLQFSVGCFPPMDQSLK